MIDSRIALGIRPPEFESPMNGMAKMLQLQGLQQANQLNTMTLQDKQRGLEEQNQLRALYARPDFDPSTPNGLQQIRRVSPAQGVAMQKAQLDALKTGGEIKRTDAETQAKLFGIAQDRYKTMQTTMGALAQSPNLTRDMVVQTGRRLVGMGIMPPEMFEAGVANLPDDPEQLRAELLMDLKTQLTPEQMLTIFAPKVSTVDNGQQISRVDDNPNSPTFGQQVGAAPVQKQATPGEVMTDTRTRSEGALNRQQSAAQFKVTQERAAEAALAEDGGPSQSAYTKKFGKAPPGYRWKPDGSQEPVPGGLADRKANEQTAGKETVDSVVAGLRSAYDSLEKGGGITSTNQNMVENLAASLSKSGVGQAVGGAVGSKNQKERDAIAQTRPLLLQAIMKATGMSAKQMDSNAELKLYLATATDPNLSLEANREALDRIENLYGSGATGKPPGKTVKRTGTSNGRKVVEYSDGSIEYAD